MSIIQLNHVTMAFGSPQQQKLISERIQKGNSLSDIKSTTKATIALYDIDLSIEKGELFVIVGLSGSGKSTLIRCLNLLNKPTHGDIKIDGQLITTMSKRDLRQLRRLKIAMVFQHFGLLSHRSILENVAFGLEVQNMPKSKRHTLAKEAIESVGLSGWEDKKPHQLSGGMKQRVGLARALITNPDILLMDEPYSALDPLIRRDMQNELLSLEENMNRTIVFITHDMNEAFKMGDRIALMKDGEIVQLGTPQSFFEHPANDYVKNFIQDVDKTQILRAKNIFNPFENIPYVDSSIEDILTYFNVHDVSFTYLKDRKDKFVGYVFKKDISTHTTSITPHIQSIDPVYRNQYLKDILPKFKDDFKSLPVVDHSGRFKGDLTKSHIIEAISS